MVLQMKKTEKSTLTLHRLEEKFGKRRERDAKNKITEERVRRKKQITQSGV